MRRAFRLETACASILSSGTGALFLSPKHACTYHATITPSPPPSSLSTCGMGTRMLSELSRISAFSSRRTATLAPSAAGGSGEGGGEWAGKRARLRCSDPSTLTPFRALEAASMQQHCTSSKGRVLQHSHAHSRQPGYWKHSRQLGWRVGQRTGEEDVVGVGGVAVAALDEISHLLLKHSAGSSSSVSSKRPLAWLLALLSAGVQMRCSRGESACLAVWLQKIANLPIPTDLAHAGVAA